MKLIFCPECHDLVRLWIGVERSCICGKVSGRYIDNTNAEVSKSAISVAIGNGSLQDAVYTLLRNKDLPILREDWKPLAPVEVWLRPNSGVGNPHTKERE